MAEDSDYTLIKSVIAGRDDSFQQLIQRHQDLVAQLVWRLVPTPQDREEVCQDVFVKVYFNLDKFRFDSKFSTWLYTVTYRTALSFLRKRRLDTEEFEEQLHDAGSTQQSEHDFSATLQSEIGRLNLDERTAITLYHLQECSVGEIAHITGKPEGTIKNLLFRTRRKLKRRLGRLHDEFREVV